MTKKKETESTESESKSDSKSSKQTSTEQNTVQRTSSDAKRKTSMSGTAATSPTTADMSHTTADMSHTTADMSHTTADMSHTKWENPAAVDMPSTGYDPRDDNIQRALKGTGTERDEVPGEVLDVIGSGGMPVEYPVQDALEERMDADFSDVRIHTGGKAAQAAEKIDARAFTCGNSIVFNSGEYDPTSPEGQHLLAHELAHVKQQNGGAPLSMKPKQNADLEIDPDPQLEREADEAAKDALADGPVTINRMGTDVHVQRLGGIMPVSPGGGLLGSSEEQEADHSVPADPEALAKEVEQLKKGQEKVMETLTKAQPGASSEGDWGEAAAKGIYGSLAGAGAGAATGAALGSAVPGVGTAIGAAVGAAVSGAASDLTKEGIDVLSDKVSGSKAQQLDEMYEEMQAMYKELKDEKNAHIKDSQGVGSSRGDQ